MILQIVDYTINEVLLVSRHRMYDSFLVITDLIFLCAGRTPQGPLDLSSGPCTS